MRDNEWSGEIASVIMGTVIAICLVMFMYTQRYVEDGMVANTATSGIWWTRTIDLKQYRVIGEGSGLFGKYTLVTRSAMQGKGENTSIYKD